MRVLTVITSLAAEWGGPPRVVIPLVEELATRGIECGVFAVDIPRNGSQLRPAGVETRLFPPGPLARWWKGHSGALGRALRGALSGFDLVHIHEVWNYPHFAAWRSASRWSIPYVITPHGGLEPAAMRFKPLRKHLYFWAVQRQILAGASALHAITETEVGRIRSLGLKNPVAMIPNGVRLEEFDHLPDRAEFEVRHPALSGKVVLLFMGRLHPIKGLDLIADVFATIAKQRNDICLVIAGPDETGIRAGLEAKLAAEVASRRVIFTGLLRDRERLAAFARADIFVLPARSEVRGLVTLEAMASQLPVVVTQECGFPEVGDAQAGLVVRSAQVDLISAITRLADDGTLRRTLGRNGRQLVERHFTWPSVADRMLSLYRSVLTAPRTSPPLP